MRSLLLVLLAACDGGSPAPPDAGPKFPYLCPDWGDGGQRVLSIDEAGGALAIEPRIDEVAGIGAGSLMVAGYGGPGLNTASTMLVGIDPAGTAGAPIVRDLVADQQDQYDAIAPRGDGYLVAGTMVAASLQHTDTIVVAIDAHGAIDPTFCGGMLRIEDNGIANDRALAIRDFDFDGGFLVALESGTGVEVREYTAACALDAGYGSGGIATIGITRAGALIRNDASSAIVGVRGNEAVVATIGSTGTPGPEWIVEFQISGEIGNAAKIASAPDGLVVAATGPGPRTRIAHISGGALDTTFGVGGYAMYEDDAATFIGALAVDPGGRIYIGSEFQFVNRLAANGMRDTTFGDNGRVRIDETSFSAVRAITFLPDGRAIAGGHGTVGLTLSCIP